MKTVSYLKSSFVICLLCSLSIFSSCRKECNVFTKGKGAYVTWSSDLTGFNGVNNSINAKVYVKQAENYKIEIKAQENIREAIRLSISNNQLILDFPCANVKHDGIEVWIEMPEINSLTVSGRGELKSENLIETSTLSTIISGVGKINVSANTAYLSSKISGSGIIQLNGTSTSANYEISGSGNILGFEMISDDVKVNISGSGKLECFANIALGVRISGSGNVFYKGYPTQHSFSVSGSGRVINAN